MKVIPMRTHLMLDYISGALLAVSPWLFGFAHFVAAPHGVMGLLEIGIAFVTLMRPVYGEDRAHAHAV
jgi:hypothetical protein